MLKSLTLYWKRLFNLILPRSVMVPLLLFNFKINILSACLLKIYELGLVYVRSHFKSRFFWQLLPHLLVLLKKILYIPILRQKVQFV